MIQFILCCLLSVSAYAAETKVATETLAAKITETIYFSAKQSGTFGQWVKDLSLPPATTKDIQAYLVGHHLDNTKIPAMSWKPGTNQIKTSTMVIDFTDVPTRQILSVDGKTFSINAKQIFFSELMQKMQDARHKPHQVSAWLMTYFESAATAEDVSDTVLAGLSYMNLFSQWGLCTGSESGSRIECLSAIYPDSKMIQTDLGANAKISQFVCANGKFKNLSYSVPENSQNTFQNLISISATQDSTGKLQAVKTTTDNYSCEYSISKDKIVRMIPSPSYQSTCVGRTYSDGDDQYQSHDLKVGDHVRNYSSIPVPFDRLESCCADADCPYKVLGKTPPKHDETPSTMPFGGEGTGVP